MTRKPGPCRTAARLAAVLMFAGLLLPAQWPAAAGQSNRLIREASPYLLQHAHNPVDWYPWGEQAFARARRENKLIFLSIGYSTCHWCHVMEEESYSDSEVAALINQSFVAIKVDREERPDIDQVYMNALQLMTGSGGWPINIVMTPDKQPFFAATYLPKHTRFGRPGLMELLPRIEEVWQHQRQDVIGAAGEITAALHDMNKMTAAAGEIQAKVLQQAYQKLAGRFDAAYGGFGWNEKFPRPHIIRFLLRYWKHNGNDQALRMAEQTLAAMRQGGIYDHVGGGFHRYATDRTWRQPHFEKMLYDQALIAMAYIEAYLATGKDAYAGTARATFDYVLRDMVSSDGGFYSAEDADSEAGEGAYYQWTEAQIRQALDKETAALFIQVFHMQSDGNYEDRITGDRTGRNILYRDKPWAEQAVQLHTGEKELRRRMQVALARLRGLRQKRPAPFKDDKVLTSWNGLMIAALAMGGRVLADPQYTESARRAATFVVKHMRSQEGRLLHRYRQGQAGIAGNLDDYAFLAWGLLELYETTFDVSLLREALDLNRIMLEDFGDTAHGGLFHTAHSAEALLIRTKEASDGDIPSGNSVALLNCLRLARITGSAELEQKAAALISAFAGSVQAAPAAYAHFLMGIDFALAKDGFEIVIAGNPAAQDTQAMLQAVHQLFLPNSVTLLLSDGPDGRQLRTLAPFTRYQKAIRSKATAYVCRNYACNQPVTAVSRMLGLLKADRSPAPAS